MDVQRDVDSFYDCRAKCVMHGPECTHFTYQAAEATCYLKNIDGSVPEILTSAPGFVSGNSFCEKDSKPLADKQYKYVNIQFQKN